MFGNLQIVNLHIEKLPEGGVPGDVGSHPRLGGASRTVTETLAIARDVAKKLLEARSERQGRPALPEAGDSFDYPL